MNIASYLSRYLLAAVFAVELSYKIIDWNLWIGRFTSLLPFYMPWKAVFVATAIFAVLEGLLVILLLIGKEKFITGWIALALLLVILISTQRITIATGFGNPLNLVHGIIKDAHLWMMLAAGFIIANGWKDIKRRRRRSNR